MRPRSIAGPMVLILIGVVFLLYNLRPDLRIIDLLSRFWPYLLVGWGILRLFEIVIWAARSRPLPTSGVSGGEWTLVVFLVLIGSGARFVHERGDWWWPRARIMARGIEVFGEPYDYPLAERSVPAPKNARVIIENLRGNTRIIGADITEVKIAGRKTVRALQRSEADADDKRTPLEATAQGEQVLIRTMQERASGENRVSTDLEITVPRGASIEAKGRRGDFDITDLDGGVEIKSDNAGVRLANIGGAIRIETRASDIIRATGAGASVELKGRGHDLELDTVAGPITITASYYGDVQLRNLKQSLRWSAGQNQFNLEQLPGELRMDLREASGSNLVGPVKISARSRDIDLSNFTGALEISVDRGDIHLSPVKLPLSPMNVRSHSGNIEVALPPKAEFTVKAVSRRGDIENDFGPPLERTQNGRSFELAGAVGKGPLLNLASDRGTVSVRKNSAFEQSNPPLPPKAPKPPRATSLTVIDQ